MKTDRKDKRITPQEFSEYKVRIDLDELTLEGLLGNISESGLCVVMEGISLEDEVGSILTGGILSKSLHEYWEFQGNVVWCRKKDSSDTIYLAGIEFPEPVQLSPSLLAKTLSIR